MRVFVPSSLLVLLVCAMSSSYNNHNHVVVAYQLMKHHHHHPQRQRQRQGQQEQQQQQQVSSSSLSVPAPTTTSLFSSSFSSSSSSSSTTTTTTTTTTRRDACFKSLGFVLSGIVSSSIMGTSSQVAFASGGATAGKYTTIPIAKRRYYGRVQQGVHDFLELGAEVLEQDMNGPKLQTFFDPQGTVIVAAKRKDIQGQCTKKDGNCAGKEVRDSRYNDMKTSMYLLGNAFRTDQQKAPDRLPTVKAAKAFFKEMDAMEKRVRTKSPKKKDTIAVQYYINALEILDQYLDLVELPPTESGYYEQEFDTQVGATARIT